jgi:hypothetical protein
MLTRSSASLAAAQVSVTWCYLCAAPAWSERLPASIGSRLRDAKDALFGPAFPHIGTMDLALAPPQVNLLHEMCSWVVTENAAAFRAALAPEHAPKDADAAVLARAPAAEPRDDRGRAPLAGGRVAPGGRTAVAAAAAAAAVAAAAAAEPAAATAVVGGADSATEPPPSRLSRAVRALLNALPSG